MPDRTDRMFHVIVLGGIGLVGAACGGSTSSPSDAGLVSDALAEGEDARQDANDGGGLFPDASTDALPSEEAGHDAALDADDDGHFPVEAPR